MKKLYITPLAIFLLAGCVNGQQHELTYSFGDGQQIHLERGITTKTDVGEVLGSADAVGWAGEGLQSWIYYARAHRPQALYITFNESSKAVDFKTLKSAK